MKVGTKPEGPRDGCAHAVTPVSDRTTAKVAKRARKSKAAWSPAQSRVDAVLSRPVRPYRVHESYRLGDRVEHTTYGVGIVDEILGPTKMQVFFTSGHRKMMQGAIPMA